MLNKLDQIFKDDMIHVTRKPIVGDVNLAKIRHATRTCYKMITVYSLFSLLIVKPRIQKGLMQTVWTLINLPRREV